MKYKRDTLSSPESRTFLFRLLRGPNQEGHEFKEENALRGRAAISHLEFVNAIGYLTSRFRINVIS